MRTSSPFMVILFMVLLSPARSQGSRTDYDRANSLGHFVASRVFLASVKPNWIAGSDRFWYRNDKIGGKREFVLVDPTTATKKPAFDHVRVAAGLSKAMGQEVASDHLPVDRITFLAGRQVLLLHVRDKSFACDLNTYEIKPETQVLGATMPVSPSAMPDGSTGGADETRLTFLNKTADDVSLLWIDSEGQRHGYGVLHAGVTREVHTYVGHLWLVTDMTGKSLVAFIGADLPLLATIEGPVAAARTDCEPDHAAVTTRKWIAFVKDHNVFLRDSVSNEETRITTDGTAADSYEGEPIWSPDGSKFVLLKTEPEQEHKVYLVESSPKDQEQPKLKAIQYLKPGDRIAHSRPHLFDAATKRDIPIKDDLFPNPWEISRVEWQPDSRRFTFLYNQRGHQVMRLIAVGAINGRRARSSTSRRKPSSTGRTRSISPAWKRHTKRSGCRSGTAGIISISTTPPPAK